MQSHLVAARWEWCRKVHVPLDFSSALEDVGKLHPAKLLRLIRIVWRVWKERLRGPVDVLFYPPCGPRRVPFWRDIVVLLCVRWTARRLVLHFHAGGFDLLGEMLTPPERLLARAAYGKADAAVVLLPSLKGEVDWIRPRRVQVVPNGIPDEALPVRGRADPPVILSVGTLSEGKGTIRLLEACRILRSRGVRCAARIAGAPASPAFGALLERERRRLRLEDSVSLVGPTGGSAKQAEYAGSSVFCFPSTDTENLPVVLLEAMRAGLPVVACRWRALGDVVAHGETGLLCDPRDPTSLASALETLLLDADLRERMGRHGRALFEQRYTLGTHLCAMEEVFRSAASARGMDRNR